MRFLVDECVGPTVARWLEQQGHDVVSVYHHSRGADDNVLLQMAFSESRILITNDKDFGQIVFREGMPHKGVILFRLVDERKANKIAVLERLLQAYSLHLLNNFVVVTEDAVRIAAEHSESAQGGLEDG